MAQPKFDVVTEWEPFLLPPLAIAEPQARSAFDLGANPVGVATFFGASGQKYAMKVEYVGALGEGFQITIRED
jgi:hypothetical protein